MTDHVKGMINFINKSPTPYHAVDSVKQALTAVGFTELRERDEWNVKPNGKYFFTRNQSAIIAFAVGGQYKSGNGFNIVGSHTDSPCPKLKPRTEIKKEGWLKLGVQLYGGGTWTTWFDRDLTIAGRVLVKKGDGIDHRLIHVEKPILRIPHLAIHLDRTINEKFAFNKETQFVPIFGTELKAGIEKQAVAEKDNQDQKQKVARHPQQIMNLIAKEAECDVDDIVDFDICVVDAVPATVAGLEDEFVFAPRLDNLCHCYCTTQSLIEACNDSSWLESEPNISMTVLFDNEEVGSLSAHGAQSTMLIRAITRLTNSPNEAGLDMALARSMHVSADMAHAVHPNYSEKHEDNMKPQLHMGPVVKINCNTRYATTAVTNAMLHTLAHKNDIPIQELAVRNDSSCGTTIGPICSANTGIRTVDIGNPQLSMHSIREMCGTTDIKHCVDLMKVFFTQWTALEDGWDIDHS